MVLLISYPFRNNPRPDKVNLPIPITVFTQLILGGYTVHFA